MLRLLPLPSRWTLAVTLAAALGTSAAWSAPAEGEPRWAQLTPAERQVLQPLEREWGTIDPARKLKWRELAAQFPRLSAERQELLRSRMNAWARMSPAERTTARLRYQEAKQLPEAERRARWESYQSLPEDQRKALADKAQSRRAEATPLRKAGTAGAPAEAQPRSNTAAAATAPGSAMPHRTVSPGTVRATVGASTRTIGDRPAPPAHQQAGLPKIVAGPGFVDSSTLLPQRGPQGAATVQTDFETR